VKTLQGTETAAVRRL